MATLSISNAWDETRSIIARDGRLIASVALALFVLPGVILDLSLPEASPGSLPNAGAWIAVAFIAVTLSIAGQLAVLRLAMAPQIAVQDAIGHGFRRLPYYLAAAILWTLPFLIVGYFLVTPVVAEPHSSGAELLGLTALLPVFAFFSIRFTLTSAVASAEAAGPVAILRRSWDLTSGHWWALFGFALLFGLAVLTLSLTAQFVTGILARLFFGSVDPWTIGGLLVAFVSQLVTAGAYSTFFIMLARIYVQLAGATASVPRSGT